MEKLELKHRVHLQKMLDHVDTCLSEYCFANLYLFRDRHAYELLIDVDCIFIKGLGYDGKTYIFPCCDLDTVDQSYLDRLTSWLDGRVDMLFPIPEKWLKYFPADKFDAVSLEDDMDYVFTRDKLMNYPGRHLHNKRNLVKQFVETYEFEVHKIDDVLHIEKALAILDGWQAASGMEKSETDYAACREALEKALDLKLEGYLFIADGKPAGFTLGERINPKVYGLHFAKADKNFKGIYQFMFSRTAELIDAHYEYLNLEQDLGSMQLRAAKSSYLPDVMVKKYRITTK